MTDPEGFHLQLFVKQANANNLYLRFNPYYEQKTGKTEEELAGLGWIDLIHPQDHSTVLRVYDQHFTRRTHFTITYRIQVAGGEYREILETGTPIYNGQEFTGYIVAGQFANTYLDEVRKLELSEKKYRDVFNSFIDVYFQIDRKGQIVNVTPSISELLGYAAKEVMGKNVNAYFIYNSKNKAAVKDLLKKRQVKNFAVTLFHKDGTALHCSCNLRIFLDEASQSLTIEGVARDVSELFEKNQQLVHAKNTAEKSLKAKELFLANMSHEIRTPLNGILGLIDLLDAEASEKQQPYLQTMKSSSQVLLSIINDILDISKIEAGKMKLSRSSIYLHHVLADAIELYRQNAQEKGIRLGLHISPEVPEWVSADRTKLTQVVSNLVSNAIKFTKEGRVSVQVEPAEGGKLLKILVLDTGIGMPESAQKRLFRDFTQLNSTTRKQFGGTGLGLSISKKLAELMGGDILVDSRVGEGSTFTLLLPLVAGKPRSLAKPIGDAVANHRALRILVVDDNRTNVFVAGEMLKSMGHKVLTAQSGEDALKCAESEFFDLILLDIQMPVMDGIETLQRLRTGDSRNNATYVTCLTAYSMKGDKEKFLAYGFDNYLPKPVTLQSLAGLIDQFLSTTPGMEDEGGEPLAAKEETPETNGEPAAAMFGRLAGMLGNEAAAETYEGFFGEVAELIEGVEGVDEAELTSRAHTVKGAALTLGFERLGREAERVEKRLRNKDYVLLLEQSQALRRAAEEVLHDSGLRQLAQKP